MEAIGVEREMNEHELKPHKDKNWNITKSEAFEIAVVG